MHLREEYYTFYAKAMGFSIVNLSVTKKCVISFRVALAGCSLGLFNVESGVLLRVIYLERNVYYVAVCPRKRLRAIGQRDSRFGMSADLGFELIQVHLPRDKDSSKTRGDLNKS